MTIQEALMIAGQASAVMAVLLLALACRTYVVDDIRGVRDDLSGRRRMRGLRDARNKVAHSAAHEPDVDALRHAEPRTMAMVRDRVEEETLAMAGDPAKGTSFVVTRDVVVCHGGER